MSKEERERGAGMAHLSLLLSSHPPSAPPTHRTQLKAKKEGSLGETQKSAFGAQD